MSMAKCTPAKGTFRQDISAFMTKLQLMSLESTNFKILQWVDFKCSKRSNLCTIQIMRELQICWRQKLTSTPDNTSLTLREFIIRATNRTQTAPNQCIPRCQIPNLKLRPATIKFLILSADWLIAETMSSENGSWHRRPVFFTIDLPVLSHTMSSRFWEKSVTWTTLSFLMRIQCG